jgi:hypothetical protein
LQVFPYSIWKSSPFIAFGQLAPPRARAGSLHFELLSSRSSGIPLASISSGGRVPQVPLFSLARCAAAVPPPCRRRAAAEASRRMHAGLLRSLTCGSSGSRCGLPRRLAGLGSAERCCHAPPQRRLAVRPAPHTARALDLPPAGRWAVHVPGPGAPFPACPPPARLPGAACLSATLPVALPAACLPALPGAACLSAALPSLPPCQAPACLPPAADVPSARHPPAARTLGCGAGAGDGPGQGTVPGARCRGAGGRCAWTAGPPHCHWSEGPGRPGI